MSTAYAWNHVLPKRNGRTSWRPLPASERYWAHGALGNARYAHRIVGEWAWAYRQTACGSSISLNYPDSWGGEAFENIEDVPPEFVVCLRCVANDETVE